MEKRPFRNNNLRTGKMLMDTEKIRQVDPLLEPAWDRFVEGHRFGLIYHLSGWKRLIENSFAHITGHYFTITGKDGRFRAALPVFEVRSWLTGDRLVSIPFATLCDPLIDTAEDYKTLLVEVEKLSKELKSSYIEIRALNSVELIGGTAGNDSFKCHYLSLEQEPELISKKFHPSLRQKLRKVSRSSLEMRIAEDESDMRLFFKLNLLTRKRLGLPPQPYRFFKTLWETFHPHRMRLAIAEIGNTPIAGVLLFMFKDRISAEFTTTDWNFINSNPVHFLYWETIKWGHAEGYRVFDFGRTEKSNTGLMSFKDSWGTEVVDLPHFYYPAGKNGVGRSPLLHKLAFNVFRKSPQFAARLMGSFCYAHMG